MKLSDQNYLIPGNKICKSNSSSIIIFEIRYLVKSEKEMNEIEVYFDG